MNLPFEEIKQLIEDYATAASDAGFTAGVMAASQPWQGMPSAPRDGTSVILALGNTRCIGYWAAMAGCWKQQGTGRAIQPNYWMVLPPLPKGVKLETDVGRERFSDLEEAVRKMHRENSDPSRNGSMGGIGHNADPAPDSDRD